MSKNQEPVNKSDGDRRKLKRNTNSNEDPSAKTPIEDVITKKEEEKETEYYEEGNGGATD